MSQIKIYLTSNKQGTIALELPIKNWKDITRDLERDELYDGILINYSIGLEFVKDGAAFIKDLYETYGFVNNICSIKIYELNYSSKKYELYFFGNLDWSTYSPSEEDVKIDAVQDNDIQKLLNNDDIEIDVLKNESIDGITFSDFSPFLRDVKLHSQILEREYLSDNQNNITEEYTIPIIESLAEWVYFPQLKYEVLQNDFSSNEIPNYPIGVSILNPSIVSKFLLETEFDGNFDFNINQEYSVTIDVSASGSTIKDVLIGIRIAIYRNRNENSPQDTFSDGVVGDVLDQYLYTLDQAFTPEAIKTFSIVIDQNINVDLERGDRVYLIPYFRNDNSVLGTPPLDATITLNQTVNKIEISANTTLPESNCKAIYEHDVIARMTDLIIGRENSFRSDFLGRLGSYGFGYESINGIAGVMLTNGSYIKDAGNGQMLFKYSELWESIKLKYDLVMDFELNSRNELSVRVEKKDYIYSDNEIIDLGCVNGLEKRIAKDYIFNSAKIGFKDKKPKNAKTNTDFTGEKSRKFPINIIKNELDLVNPYAANGSLIEEIRRNYVLDAEKQDNSKDDDIFVLCTYKSNLDQSINSISGIGSVNNVEDSYFNLDSYTSTANLDTAYNLFLQPFHLFKRFYGKLIKSNYIKQIDLLNEVYISRFLSGEDLNDLEITFPDISYKENEDSNISDFERPLIIPEFYEFEKELTANEVKQIVNNKKGFIKFSDRYQNEKRGFLIEASFDDSSRKKKTTFKLLRKY